MAEDRIPKNLQGLFKFCMTVGDKYDETVVTEMEAEKREWLREVLDTMTVDVIKEMKDSIRIIIEKLNSTDPVEEKALRESAEILLDFIDNVDCANDFVKIGGLSLIDSLISSAKAEHRAIGGEMAAYLAQNNPFCQTQMVERGLVTTLVHLLEVEVDSVVANKKCLFALSCLVRAFPPGLEQFIEANGFSCLIHAMNSEDDPLRTKAAFMLHCLCTEYDKVQDIFLDFGLLGQLCGLLHPDGAHEPYHEYLLTTLLVLAQGRPDRTWSELTRSDCRLVEALECRVKDLDGLEEHQDSVQTARELLNWLGNEERREAAAQR